MGKCYRHLTIKDRISLYELLFSGTPIIEIAERLGFHRATIYRELERNSSAHGYRPDWASQQYKLRQQHRLAKLDKEPALKAFVVDRLREGWSPQQIDGRLRLSAKRCVISYETIYAYIYSRSGKAQKLYTLLQKRRRYRYPRIKRRRRKTAVEEEKIRIDQRTETINQRETFGHWEGDLVIFRKQKVNLITLRERKSRYMLAIKNENRKAKSTTQTLVNYMKAKLEKNVICSLTLDNDISFIEHKEMAESLGATIYFCEPYKSYQKGAIENANRLLRTKLPRQTNLNKLEQFEIDNLTKVFNDRPMRCLGYRTPEEVFYQHFRLGHTEN